MSFSILRKQGRGGGSLIDSKAHFFHTKKELEVHVLYICSSSLSYIGLVFIVDRSETRTQNGG